MDNLTRFKQLRERDMGRQTRLPVSDVDSQIDEFSVSNDTALQAIQSAFARKLQQERELQPTEQDYDFNQPQQSGSSATPTEYAMGNQSGILPSRAGITQEFGRYNPSIEPGKGYNMGVDFGIKEGTPLALPPGEWEVLQAFDKASGRGKIGNRENSGYGNSILVRNSKTGETLRYSHLSGVNVAPGKVYTGGTVIGASGATGNVTDAHLDLEYKDAKNQYKDVMRSQYGQYIFGNKG